MRDLDHMLRDAAPPLADATAPGVVGSLAALREAIAAESRPEPHRRTDGRRQRRRRAGWRTAAIALTAAVAAGAPVAPRP